MARRKTQDESPEPSIADPTTLWLSGEIESGWRLRQPILVTIETDHDGEYIVTDAFSTVYGNGATIQKATIDYCTSLIDYYQFMEEQAAGNLQNALRLQALRQYLVKITCDHSDAPQGKGIEKVLKGKCGFVAAKNRSKDGFAF